MTRWADITQSVLENCNELGFRTTNRDRILAELTKAQKDIAREALAIQADSSIVTVIGTAGYDLDDSQFRIRQIFQPTAWKRPIEIVHDDAVWRRIIAAAATGINPRFATIRNKQFLLNPAPADVQTITLWTYALPTLIPVFDVADEDATHSADPELPDEYDDPLEFSGTGRMLKKSSDKATRSTADDWLGRAAAEIAKLTQQNMKESIAGAMTTDHSSKRLGF